MADPGMIRVCFCDLDDSVDSSDPENHELGCLGAVMLRMQRAREERPYRWKPMPSRLRGPR